MLESGTNILRCIDRLNKMHACEYMSIDGRKGYASLMAFMGTTHCFVTFSYDLYFRIS